MKYKAGLSFLMFFMVYSLQAQESRFKLGFRFAPGISMTRVEDQDPKDELNFSSGDWALRFSAGLVGDFYFSKNYCFHTGLWYTVLNSGVKVSKGSAEATSILNIQNIQVPFALKFFTNEIATDMKIYFTLGGTLSGKIKEKRNIEFKTNDLTVFSTSEDGDNYWYGDAGLLLGMGLEYRSGESTTFFGGLSYNRGLLNVATSKGPITLIGKNDISSSYRVNHHIFSLEGGIYF